MSMYVLQVLTGKETPIRLCLHDIGIEAFVPQEERLIRVGGKWTNRLYTLFPSYVFVALDQVGMDYYRIRQVTGIIRFLELHGGAATSLSTQEERFIRGMCHDGRPAPVSHVILDGDKIVPLDGPLKVYGNAGYDIRYDRHAHRARIYTLDSIKQDVWLSFDIIKSPDPARG